MPGVYVDLLQLLALEHPARQLRWPPNMAPAHSLLAGRHRSRVRGRGLDFVELRHYLPGDDTRNIDWRASARTGKPQLRVYAEERERPTWLIVDQRIAMFFARRGALRSVVAAEAAAIWGWRALAGGDRVGGIVFGDDGIDLVTARRGRRSMLHLLNRLAARNQALRADSATPGQPQQLDAALALLARQAPREAIVAVFSAFDGLGPATRTRLLALSRHNDLVLLPVWEDPETLRPARIVVSDGSLQLPVDHANAKVRARLAEAAQKRMHDLLGLRAELGCAVMPLLTSEPALVQLARGMDGRRPASMVSPAPSQAGTDRDR
ncbi:MAG TPA: DUF58 domain-containing protein [Thauera sp.]|nr:DUF58 domain-containing protein [Thauera sp.]